MNDDEKIELMKKYLLMKFNEEDWHGVADAAMDLREMIARRNARKGASSERRVDRRSRR